MARRNRSDSTSEQVKAIGLEPPARPAHVHLRECDTPFWDSIIAARAYHTWTAADLEQAANLAACKADIVRLQSELDSEGFVVEGSTGSPVINPKFRVLDVLVARSITLSRLLHVHAAATQGRSSDTGQRTKAERRLHAIDTSGGLIPH